MRPEDEKKIEDLTSFLHEAFCIEDGSVKYLNMVPPRPGFNCVGMLFQLEDKKRGLWYVTLSYPN